MSDRRALPQEDYSPNPFADGHHLRFQEPQPRPFESTTTLPQDFGGQGGQYDDDELEKQPLTGGNVAGGFYPPGCVEHHVKLYNSLHFILPRPIDPSQYGDPYARPLSVASDASSGVDTAWRRRQTIRRGVKKTVKLINGNFITEYPVPTPVYSAVEAKWKSGVKTTEFS